jgi:radical SAM superfamily enzyme
MTEPHDNPKEETPMGTLTADCGHHCGTRDGTTGHCPCADCHDRPEPGDYATGLAAARAALRGEATP